MFAVAVGIVLDGAIEKRVTIGKLINVNRMEQELIQFWTPEKPFCIICGEPTSNETCRPTRDNNCKKKLAILRSSVKEKIIDEKVGENYRSPATIRKFNELEKYT